MTTQPPQKKKKSLCTETLRNQRKNIFKCTLLMTAACCTGTSSAAWHMLTAARASTGTATARLMKTAWRTGTGTASRHMVAASKASTGSAAAWLVKTSRWTGTGTAAAWLAMITSSKTTIIFANIYSA